MRDPSQVASPGDMPPVNEKQEAWLERSYHWWRLYRSLTRALDLLCRVCSWNALASWRLLHRCILALLDQIWRNRRCVAKGPFIDVLFWLSLNLSCSGRWKTTHVENCKRHQLSAGGGLQETMCFVDRRAEVAFRFCFQTTLAPSRRPGRSTLQLSSLGHGCGTVRTISTDRLYSSLVNWVGLPVMGKPLMPHNYCGWKREGHTLTRSIRDQRPLRHHPLRAIHYSLRTICDLDWKIWG